jgi:hypothetical protein
MTSCFWRLVRRLEAAKLEMAMLPEATVRLTEMLRHGDVPIAHAPR